MATIYEIKSAMLECIDPETGEIDVIKLEELEDELRDKLEGVGCWIKNLKSDIEALRTEEKALAERRRVMENKVESLKNYMAYHLDGEKFSTPKIAVSFRRSKAVEIYNIDAVSDKYKTYTPKVDKAAIKDAIAKGESVEGAELIENYSIQIK